MKQVKTCPPRSHVFYHGDPKGYKPDPGLRVISVIKCKNCDYEVVTTTLTAKLKKELEWHLQ